MKTLQPKEQNRYQLKLLVFAIALIASFLNPLFQLHAKPFKIYVSQVSQHPALDASRQGIYDELIASGYQESIDFIWIYDNAQGNIALATQIAQKAVGYQADAIVTLGTSVTQAAVSASRGYDIPILFASVTDPVGAGIVKSLENPGDFVTGVSNLTPALPQFELFQKLQPSLKTIGLIYNPGEPNSIALLADMEAAATALGLHLILAPAFKTSEVSVAANSLVGKVDAFYVNNDNTVLAAFGCLTTLGLNAGIPTFVSDTDMVETGALAALGPNQYQLGRQVGRMLIRILNGEHPSSIPVQFADNTETVINQKIADQLQLKIPD